MVVSHQRFMKIVAAFTCLSSALAYLDRRYRGQKIHRIPFLVVVNAQGESSTEIGRELQVNGTGGSSCSLCNGFPVLKDVIPPYEPTSEIPPGLSCEVWDGIVSEIPREYYEYAPCPYFHGVFSSSCCDTPPPYLCEQSIRSAVLENYDSAVAPVTGEKLEITLQLDFYHISDLDLTSATAEIFVWLHLNWTDPRLAWGLNESLAVENDWCSTNIMARASLDSELTDIWVPDFDLLNQATGVQQMPEAMASVYPDGSVVWVRNGGLRALCFFSGLRAFPYDTLGCSFLMGAWTRQYDIKIVLGGENGDGFFVGDTAQNIQYTEYHLIPNLTETGNYEGAEYMVFYNFYFERAQRYYITKIVIPTTVFTVLSFGVFLLDPRVGERLTYGLTVLLVIIAQDIVTAQRLPVANERLWINVFTNASFYWVLVAMLESIFVMWLYFLNDHRTEESNHQPEMEANPTVKDLEAKEEVENYGNGRHLDTEEDGSPNESSSEVTYDGQYYERNVEFDENVDERPALRKKASRKMKTFRQELFSSTSSDPHRQHFIKRFDRICFIVVPTTYILFVIIMLATKSLWDNERQEQR